MGLPTTLRKEAQPLLDPGDCARLEARLSGLETEFAQAFELLAGESGQWSEAAAAGNSDWAAWKPPRDKISRREFSELQTVIDGTNDFELELGDRSG